MQALVLNGPGLLELADVAEPEAGAREAIVAVERAGVCGTDLSILSGSIPVNYPRIVGHELVGSVVSAPAGAHVSPGRRVLIDPSRACGICRECRADRPNICPNGALMGRDVDGGFAERVSVDVKQLHQLPTTLSLERSAMLQVLGVCVHAQRVVDVFPGQTAAVIGLGVSGLLMVQLLRARGVDTVVGVTRSASKRQLAETLGATVTAAPDAAARVVATATGGSGTDIVIECVGSVATLSQGIQLVALGGTVVLFGTITATEGSLPFYEMYRRELTLHNPRAALPRDYDLAIDLLTRGRIRVDEMLSDPYPIWRGTEAMEALATGAGPLKAVLEIA